MILLLFMLITTAGGILIFIAAADCMSMAISDSLSVNSAYALNVVVVDEVGVRFS